MKAVYDSTNFKGGVMRPLEIKFELNGNTITTTMLNRSQAVKDYFWNKKVYSEGISIESFYDTQKNDVSADITFNDRIFLFNSGVYYTVVYASEAQAKDMFVKFVTVIKTIRGTERFGRADTGSSNKPQPTQNKESYMNTNLTQIGTEVLSDNKEFAIFEAERVTGLAALEALEKKMIEVYPGTESFWKSKLGTFFLCNGIHAAGKIYDGPQANIVHETTKIVMRGCYAKVGQSVNLNGFIEGVFESIISVVPGMNKTPTAPENK